LRWVHTLLWLLLALDCAQLLVAAAALVRGRRSLRAGAPSHARYSYAHAALLAGGSLFLAVPIVLGLTGVVPEDIAIYLSLALELVTVVPTRIALGRFEAAHYARRA
jgi:hypothetical protein